MLDQPLLALVLAGVIGAGFELVGSILKSRLLRRVFYVGAALFTALGAMSVLSLYWSVPAVLVWLVALYRIINVFRVLYGRTPEQRNQAVTRRTTYMLLVYQAASVLILAVSWWNAVSMRTWLFILLVIALLAAMIMNLAVRRNLARASIRPSDRFKSDMELPTVSVCIPARNETDDLAACLDSVLASDYPKLEVLVLDDCSHHRTSEIIRGLARKGTRFIAGDRIRSGWLAKNQAYEALSEAASGELLLFCGVDVRFDTHTIKSLVTSLQARKKSMICVLPKGMQRPAASGLVQPMRYWWELALPRRLFNRPPALSTSWMISRQALKRTGGFKAVSNTVVPESYFARELAKSDGYSFMRASGKLGISSNKEFADQWETAVRLRYPQLRKRPEAVLLLTVAEITVLLMPLAVFVTGFFVGLGMLWVLAGSIVGLLGLIHYQIIQAWQIKNTGAAMAALPCAVLIELWLLQLSMWKYEFARVEWKDRNICIPVMSTIPRLPRLT